MITTSDTWKRLALNTEHLEEFYIDVAGEKYYPEDLEDIQITFPSFSEFSVGNACASQLNVSFYPRVDPPTMAKIVVFVRLKYNEQVSEWIQRGVYYIDVREKDPWGRLNITAYDAMLKSEQVYMGEGDVGEWPRAMPTVVNDICNRMGVPLDPRTQLKSYGVEYPNDFTMREILGYVAAAHGGNWIVTNIETLLLIRVAPLPVRTNLLVDELNQPILFGEVQILV